MDTCPMCDNSMPPERGACPAGMDHCPMMDGGDTYDMNEME